MSEPLYSNELYEVHIVEDALGEDNRTACPGYGIFNKTTNIREATGLVYGEVRWRADQFANMLKELDDRAAAEEAAESLEGLAADADVTLQ